MKIERLQMSIQTVKENIAILESQEPEDAGYYLQLEHEKMVLNALEKQTPKKPNLKNATDYEGNIVDCVYICSVCGRTICYEIEGNFEENYPYCNCGHAIDWSDHPTEKGGEG